jgi:hypothetical protein
MDLQVGTCNQPPPPPVPSPATAASTAGPHTTGSLATASLHASSAGLAPAGSAVGAACGPGSRGNSFSQLPRLLPDDPPLPAPPLGRLQPASALPWGPPPGSPRHRLSTAAEPPSLAPGAKPPSPFRGGPAEALDDGARLPLLPIRTLDMRDATPKRYSSSSLALGRGTGPASTSAATVAREADPLAVAWMAEEGLPLVERASDGGKALMAARRKSLFASANQSGDGGAGWWRRRRAAVAVAREA